MQVGDEIFFFSEERLRAKGTEITSPKEKEKSERTKLNYDESSKRSPVNVATANNQKQVSPCEERSRERSLDCPSTKLTGIKCQSSRQRTLEKATKEGSKSLVKIQVENCYRESLLPSKPQSPEEEGSVAPKAKKSDYNCRGSLSDSDCGVINKSSVKSKKCNSSEQPATPSYNSNAKKPPSSSDPASKNKFTWCGSCKSSKNPGSSLGLGSKTAASAAAAVAAAHERQAKSYLKRLSRSSLSTDSAAADANNKISLNLSKYSPCASRLAASSKILSSDSLGYGPGASGGTSPESPLHTARAKSPVQPCLSLKIQKLQEQPTPSRSKSVSDSCVTSPTSDATSSSPPGTEVISLEDVSQNREERWNCNHRNLR
ncbi:uncharacterized protein LOC131668996 [Phymastichus coffea]|uniref:uncharacterized protein LOC131668996 n=1 Tax=Phymastichus coffea TaxID=108790 RepID=UPI00273B0687|nr:uncharacterized protein LOC131668996 [Phymastichus coffea]